MRLSTTAALLAVSLLFACNRPGPPSPEYEEAREKWSTLVRERLDDAAIDPGADEVLRLLGSVDAKSIDSQYARDLKAEIEAARAEATRRDERSAESVATAQAALRPVVSDSLADEEAEAPAAPVEPPASAKAPAAADAGQDSGQPEEGMDASEFRSKFARCFEYKNDSLVGGVGGGQVWALKDLSICRQLHPRFSSNSVLLFEGKIAIRSSAELAPERYILVDGQLVPEQEGKKLLEQKKAAQAAPANP